jgi:hypothetical protein
MAIADDFSVDASKNIRHVSGTARYTVLAKHAWTQDMLDDASYASAGDNVSIESDNLGVLDGGRSTLKPMALNLLNGYNIDDVAAQFLYYGSIQQDGTNTLYTGLKSLTDLPLVAGSPMYVVQAGAKLTKYWPDGHIQLLVKCKSGGVLIDNADVRVFSRKYGQTYSDSGTNLIGGGEQPVGITTALTDWTPLSLAAALALSSKVAISIGSHTRDTGDGNGAQTYKGTITLSNGCTIAEAAQYCQAICNETSTVTIDGVPGWRFRVLGEAAGYGYTPLAAAPFGIVAGGKWFVEQGWDVVGALAADLQKFQMKSHTGVTVTNPIVAGITIGGLSVGARVLCGRDDGTGFLTNEYTLAVATTAAGNTCTITEAIKADTPATGTIRIGSTPYAYTSFNAATKTFTITGTWGKIIPAGTFAWVPFIDTVATGATAASANYTYLADFGARLRVRLGGGSTPLRPFETTFTAGSSATNGVNAIATSDI